MKKTCLVLLLLVALAPSAVAFRQGNLIEVSPAYIQDGNRDLC